MDCKGRRPQAKGLRGPEDEACRLTAWLVSCPIPTLHVSSDMPAPRASEQRPPQRVKRRIWPGRVLLIGALSLGLWPGTWELARAWFSTMFVAALGGDHDLMVIGGARIAIVLVLGSALVLAARLAWTLERGPRRVHADAVDELCVPARFRAVSVALAFALLSVLAVRHLPHAVRLLEAGPTAGELIWRGVLGRAAGLSLIFAILAAACEEVWLRAEVRRRDLAWAKQHQHRPRATAGFPH